MSYSYTMAVKNCGLWMGALCFILVVMVHDVASMKHNCAREDCVDLKQCPELVKLLRNPTNNNIKSLQDATCFISGTDPQVCCPRPTTTKPKVSLLPKKCGQGLTINRVVGGEETPLGGYPWMAVMGYKEIGFDKIEYHCGGSVINERYILTAAHCVAPNLLAIRSLEVITLGEWELKNDFDCITHYSGLKFCSAPPQNFTYDEIIIHPNYDTRAYQSDDIALIRLSKNIDLSGPWIHPICLPSQGLDARTLMTRHEAVVAGWGVTENGSLSDRLLHVKLPLLDKQKCSVSYKNGILNEQLCMGGRIGEDSCSGDSGGPVAVRGPSRRNIFLQIGIVSYGPTNCGLPDFPAVYTEVSHYINWIESNLRP